MITFSGGRRLRDMVHKGGEQYTHLIHVGVGWAFARLHRRPWLAVRFGEPVLCWLAWDGCGFHQAYFDIRDVVDRQWVERAARGEVRPIRDQGSGRALWFYAGADPVRLATIIGNFPEQRRPDLWAGIGLAASYTEDQSADVVEKLACAADGCRGHLGQGAAFAAKAHFLSGVAEGSGSDHRDPHSRVACCRRRLDGFLSSRSRCRQRDRVSAMARQDTRPNYAVSGGDIH